MGVLFSQLHKDPAKDQEEKTQLLRMAITRIYCGKAEGQKEPACTGANATSQDRFANATSKHLPKTDSPTPPPTPKINILSYVQLVPPRVAAEIPYVNVVVAVGSWYIEHFINISNYNLLLMERRISSCHCTAQLGPGTGIRWRWGWPRVGLLRIRASSSITAFG